MKLFQDARKALLGAAIVAAVIASSLRAQEPGTVVAADKRVQGKTYVFKETGKELPYALFVPSKYDATKKWPLIVGLHGLGRPYRLVDGLRRDDRLRGTGRLRHGDAARLRRAGVVRQPRA